MGLPGGWPDLLGIAVRAATGRGDEVLDVLFAAVAGRGWAHPLLVPVRSWWGRPWSTVLPYTGGGHLVWLGLETPRGPAGGGAGVAVVAAAVGHGAVSLAVTEMVAGAARRRVGTLRWDAVRQCGAPVSFDPVLDTVPGCARSGPCQGCGTGPTPAPAGAAAPPLPVWRSTRVP